MVVVDVLFFLSPLEGSRGKSRNSMREVYTGNNCHIANTIWCEWGLLATGRRARAVGKREPKQMLTARRNGKLPSGRVVVACGGRGVMTLRRQYTGKTTAPPRVWKATPQILGLYRRGGLGHCKVRERIEKGEGGEGRTMLATSASRGGMIL